MRLQLRIGVIVLVVAAVVFGLVACLAGLTVVHAAPPPIACVSESCVFSTNLPYDSEGTPDSRPGTWGDAGYDDAAVPFVNVPSGYRVRIYRVYGDLIAWAHGNVQPGADAGVLFGIITTSSGQSPFIGPGLGSSGCPVYIQDGVGASPVRAAFDFDTRAGGLLGSSNTMIVRRAVFLNDTGLSIHEEVTMVVEFRYEAEQ